MKYTSDFGLIVVLMFMPQFVLASGPTYNFYFNNSSSEQALTQATGPSPSVPVVSGPEPRVLPVAPKEQVNDKPVAEAKVPVRHLFSLSAGLHQIRAIDIMQYNFRPYSFGLGTSIGEKYDLRAAYGQGTLVTSLPQNDFPQYGIPVENVGNDGGSAWLNKKDNGAIMKGKAHLFEAGVSRAFNIYEKMAIELAPTLLMIRGKLHDHPSSNSAYYYSEYFAYGGQLGAFWSISNSVLKVRAGGAIGLIRESFGKLEMDPWLIHTYNRSVGYEVSATKQRSTIGIFSMGINLDLMI